MRENPLRNLLIRSALPPPNSLNNSELRKGIRRSAVSVRGVSACSEFSLRFARERISVAGPGVPCAITPEMLAGLSPGRQVYSLVHTWLLSGEYGPGDLLPTARDIAHFCNDISKPTVHRVLKVLVGEGLLRGVPGKGVYVANTEPPSRPVSRVARQTKTGPDNDR
jgi:GntR family transcriptional regulator